METVEKTPAEILALPMQPNDAGAATIRDYLVNILVKIWDEEEGFSGKRPFGNSGWTWELFAPLVYHNVIEGELDSEGYINDCDEDAGYNVIVGAIEALRAP